MVNDIEYHNYMDLFDLSRITITVYYSLVIAVYHSRGNHGGIP